MGQTFEELGKNILCETTILFAFSVTNSENFNCFEKILNFVLKKAFLRNAIVCTHSATSLLTLHNFERKTRILMQKNEI